MAMSGDDIKRETKKADDTYNKHMDSLIEKEKAAKKEASDKISEVAKLLKAKARSGNKNSSEILKSAEGLIKETVGEVTKDLAALITGYNKKEMRAKSELEDARKAWQEDNTEANARALAKVEDKLEKLGEDLADDIEYTAKQALKDFGKLEKEIETTQKIANTKMGEKIGKQMRKTEIASTLTRKKEFNETRNELKESLKNQRDLLKELGPGNEGLLAAIQDQLNAVESKNFEKFEKFGKLAEEQKKEIKDTVLKQALEQAKEFKKESLARRALGDTLGGGIEKLNGVIKDKAKAAGMAALNKVGNIGLGPLNLRNITKGLLGTAKFGKGLIDKRNAKGIYDRARLAETQGSAKMAALPAIGSDLAKSVPEAEPEILRIGKPNLSVVPKTALPATGSGSKESGSELDKMSKDEGSREQITELKDINKHLKDIASGGGDKSSALPDVVGTIGSLLEGSAFLKLASKVKSLLGFGGPGGTPEVPKLPTPGTPPGTPPRLPPRLPPGAVTPGLAGAAGTVGAVAAGGAAATIFAGGIVAANKEAFKVVSDNSMLSAMSGDTGFAAAIMNAADDGQKERDNPTAKPKQGAATLENRPVSRGSYSKTGMPPKVAAPTLASPAPAVSAPTLASPVPASSPSSGSVNITPTVATTAVTAMAAPTLSSTPTTSVPKNAATGSSLPQPGPDGSVKAAGAMAVGGDLKSIANVSGNVDLAGLNPSMRDNFTAMAAEYNAKTGKKLKVNSGFRSYGKQKELYDGYKAGKPGYNPAAAPGTSLHEYGFAIDADPSQVDEIKKMGLASKYGFEGIEKAGERQHLQIAGGQKAITASKSGLVSGDMGPLVASLSNATQGANSNIVASAETAGKNSNDAVRTSASPETAKVADSVGGGGTDGSSNSQGGSRMAAASIPKQSKGGSVSNGSMPTFSFVDPGMYAINVGAMG